MIDVYTPYSAWSNPIAAAGSNLVEFALSAFGLVELRVVPVASASGSTAAALQAATGSAGPDQASLAPVAVAASADSAAPAVAA